MSAELLDVLNRRTAVAAVRAEASRAGVDAEQLLDRKSFYDQVTGLDVDEAAFPRRVAELVRQHARPAPAQQSGARQWTDADVAKASPQQMTDAINAGLLRDLGYGPPRRRH